MRPLRRIFELGSCAFAPPRSLRYIGVLGIHNLGDEAVFQAARGHFAPYPVLHCVSPRAPGWARALIAGRRHAGVMLGGGTLIGKGSTGGNPALDEFERAAERGQFRIVFGTGVSAVDFERVDARLAGMLSRWQQSLRAADYVGVRGPDSVAALKRWGVNAQCIGDLACFFAQRSGYWEPASQSVGVNFGRSDRDFPELAEALQAFLRIRVRQGWRPEFFVVWPEDLEPTRRLAASAGIDHPVVHAVFRDTHDYLRRVRRMRAFVGLKLHAVILAFCAGVPSIMLEYNPKCVDFMRSIGLEEFDVRVADATASQLEERFEALVSRDTISEHALARLHRYRSLQVEAASRCRAALQAIP